jgi:hypothetical protein
MSIYQEGSGSECNECLELNCWILKEGAIDLMVRVDADSLTRLMLSVTQRKLVIRLEEKG